ncbi:Methionine aminopeptidase [Echinococcus granulosus]|uniref:Methionine aminopeptidase n=1 Tax=Echinococcus granulosus TaxID=6210 RepID=W6U4I3_ECHGR|nr:Methionine aminopeptidase [Echinococcus granulosus]EUB56030.1 Methionine aminopeptidase [Echinococcus granulosus]
MSHICVTPDCGKPATLRCPTCIKLGITGSYFCTKECFKKYWKTHKNLHLLAVEIIEGKCMFPSSELDTIFDGYYFTGPLRPAKKTPFRTIPDHIARPDYADTGIPVSEREAKSSHSIIALNKEEIEGMRVTGRLAREVLDEAIAAVGVGVTTDEIDRIVHEACIDRECYPSPLNYFNFPKSCCTSINEVICHGIPDQRHLADGDILNIDITTYFGGFHGDVNETVFVGTPNEKSIRLVKSTYNCMAKSMDAVRVGMKYRELGDVIQRHANAEGFSVVRTYCGHGVHRLFHCPPNIPHYAQNKAVGSTAPGHCFTIEPMINEGNWRDELWPDKWTAVTIDGLRSAQFEHTMIILKREEGIETPAMLENGPPLEVVTARTIKGEDKLANVELPPEDALHFRRYGRPHFVDQLHTLKMDVKAILEQKGSKRKVGEELVLGEDLLACATRINGGLGDHQEGSDVSHSAESESLLLYKRLL